MFEVSRHKNTFNQSEVSISTPVVYGNNTTKNCYFIDRFSQTQTKHKKYNIRKH